MKLSEVEKNILDDLVHDSHELWEWYAFIRYNSPDLKDDEVFRQGRDLLNVWLQRSWLNITKSRGDESNISERELFSLIDKLGLDVTDPKKGIMLLSLAEQAFEDIEWLPSSPDGMRYTNPNVPGELVRTQSGFSTAYDPLKKGPYAKISKGQSIMYAPLAGNPLLEGSVTGGKVN